VTIPGTSPPQQAETVAQTTSQFLLSTGTQYAINAGFFAPCCTAANEGKDIIGLAVSNGAVVSPIDPTRAATLVITNDNRAAVGTVLSLPANVADAVTGSDILVDVGKNVAPTADNAFNGPNPRTAAGVSQDGRTLYLLTLDGRQPGYSVGPTLAETADVLLALGAYDGVNLDGGGSTAAVAANGAGGATVLNRPSGGTERFDAANLGVYALPLSVAVPEPASAALLCVAVIVLAATRRFA
jgi:exopolysaccharide biosynthesis protein